GGWGEGGGGWGGGGLRMGAVAAGVELRRGEVPGSDRVLTPDALAFVADLQRRFGSARLDLLRRRQERQTELDAGERPDFLVATRHVRESEWTVAPAPPDLNDRRGGSTAPPPPEKRHNPPHSGANGLP